jgi:hypothetical protein
LAVRARALINGQGKIFHGGQWSVVSPAGDPVGNPAAGTGATDA